MHGQLQSGARCHKFDLKLFSVPFLEFVSSEDSGDAAHKRWYVAYLACMASYKVELDAISLN